MPSSTFWGMQHLNGNVLCSIDVKSSGPNPDNHELLELCALPLDQFFNPHLIFLLCHLQMKPAEPQFIDYDVCQLSRQKVAEQSIRGLHGMKAADVFYKWFRGLDLNPRKKLLPLAYNWAHERMFLINWLGAELFHEIFGDEYRDPLIVAQYLNDKADCTAQVLPFSKTTLSWLCGRFHIEPIQRGTVMSDALTTASLYRSMLRSL